MNDEIKNLVLACLALLMMIGGSVYILGYMPKEANREVLDTCNGMIQPRGDYLECGEPQCGKTNLERYENCYFLEWDRGFFERDGDAIYMCDEVGRVKRVCEEYIFLDDVNRSWMKKHYAEQGYI